MRCEVPGASSETSWPQLAHRNERAKDKSGDLSENGGRIARTWVRLLSLAGLGTGSWRCPPNQRHARPSTELAARSDRAIGSAFRRIRNQRETVGPAPGIVCLLWIFRAGPAGEVNDSMDNQIGMEERTRNPSGQFVDRAQRRIAELEQTAAGLTRQLHSHHAAALATPTNDVAVQPLAERDHRPHPAGHRPTPTVPRSLPRRDPLRRTHTTREDSSRGQRPPPRPAQPGHQLSTSPRNRPYQIKDERRKWPRPRWRGQQDDHAQLWVVPPAGFEPAPPPPEGGALSPELRGPMPTKG